MVALNLYTVYTRIQYLTPVSKFVGEGGEEVQTNPPYIHEKSHECFHELYVPSDYQHSLLFHKHKSKHVTKISVQCINEYNVKALIECKILLIMCVSW